MDGPIASAVMLPEPQETDDDQRSPPTSPAGQKRRQSAVAEQDAKRQRLNSIDANASSDRRGSVNGKAAVPERRERGRERRLFGAALGALSQNSATAAQRKRAEIEKRQRAQRELEGQEDDQRKLEREVQRKAQRRKEQERFERDSVRIRHANLRHMAHFLQTRAEPRLYYKPWETTVDEDERIRTQIEEAEDTIRRELETNGVRDNAYEERERDLSHREAEGAAGADRPTGKELSTDTSHQPPTANGATNDSGPSPEDPGAREDHAEGARSEAVNGEQPTVPEQQSFTSHEPSVDNGASKDVHDDNGEEVVEAAEDTVIY